MRAINAVCRIMGYVATGLLLPMMLLTVVDVFLRFAFNHPIIGTAELTSLLMLCLPLSVAWAALQGRHVTIDLVMSRFPPRVQAVVSSITFLLGLGTVAFLVWRGFMTSLYEIEHGSYASVLLPLPVFPFHWVLVFGLLLLFIVLIPLLIQQVKGVVSG